MSNQVKHTAEPWALFRDGQSVGAADGTGVCEVWPRNEEGFPNTEGKANARRIAACVNACEGIPTDDLEEAPRRGLLRLAEFSDKLIEQRGQLLEQRDQLLAALEQIARYPATRSDEMSMESARDIARAAIAAAKGGAA